MGTGAITEYVDVAQIALYAFWILFFILVGYLHREGKREGWPLQMSSGELRTGVGGMPPPKTYRLAHGQGERVKPGPEPAQYEVNATQIYDAAVPRCIPTVIQWWTVWVQLHGPLARISQTLRSMGAQELCPFGSIPITV